MPRRMSCSLTVDAVRARTKTVTRRHVGTWKSLKPGDRLTLVEKAMGLPKGARQVVLADVEVTAADVEPLGARLHADLAAEGFPNWSPGEFTSFWLESHGYRWPAHEGAQTLCRRIGWRYLDGGES